MNERTAEERLRQILEGDAQDKDFNGENPKTPRRTVRRNINKRTAPAEKNINSFMEDFEKKIEQSLNAEHTLKKAPSHSEKTPRKFQNKKISEPASSEEKVIHEPVTFDEPKPISKPVQIEETLPIKEPVQAPIQEFVEEPLEITDNEPVEVEKENEIEEPLINVNEELETLDVPVENEIEEQELPEIPLIGDEENGENKDVQDDFQDFQNEDNENNEEEFSGENEDKLPDIPLISADGEEENNIDDIEEETENENQSETFSHPADIVLNVNEEIPHNQEPEADTEGESVPVSVVMPETTKTAEDKLMADIAEAMTGSPLTLETKETPEPYKIPENFLNEVNNDPSKQSAEEKLIANIAQAMSESPLDAARENAAQDFERDLNNFENFIPSAFPENEEPLTEEFDFSQYEEKEEEEKPEEKEPEIEPEKPETEIETTFDESPLPDPVPEPDPEPAEEKENLEILEEPEQEPVNTDTSLLAEEEQEKQEEPAENNISEEPLEESEDNKEDNTNEETFNLDEKDEQTEETLTSDFSEEKEEVLQENNMPEQSLLNDENENNFETTAPALESNYDDNEEDEDFDVNSLGVLSAATSMPDYEEPEPEPEQEPVQEYNDYEKTATDTLINQGEEEEKAKVMGIREKIAERKEKMGKDTSGKKKKFSLPSFSGFNLSALLLVFLLAIGGFIAWQLIQLNDKLTSGLMNMGMPGEFASTPVENSNPSYEYAIDFIFDTNLSSRMAQRGKDGWQVVGSRRTQDSITGQLGYEFIFMRKAKGK